MDRSDEGVVAVVDVGSSSDVVVASPAADAKKKEEEGEEEKEGNSIEGAVKLEDIGDGEGVAGIGRVLVRLIPFPHPHFPFLCQLSREGGILLGHHTQCTAPSCG